MAPRCGFPDLPLNENTDIIKNNNDPSMPQSFTACQSIKFFFLIYFHCYILIFKLL
jgi:hypothetical protein